MANEEAKSGRLVDWGNRKRQRQRRRRRNSYGRAGSLPPASESRANVYESFARAASSIETERLLSSARSTGQLEKCDNCNENPTKSHLHGRRYQNEAHFNVQEQKSCNNNDDNKFAKTQNSEMTFNASNSDQLSACKARFCAKRVPSFQDELGEIVERKRAEAMRLLCGGEAPTANNEQLSSLEHIDNDDELHETSVSLGAPQRSKASSENYSGRSRSAPNMSGAISGSSNSLHNQHQHDQLQQQDSFGEACSQVDANDNTLSLASELLLDLSGREDNSLVQQLARDNNT